MIMSSLLSLEAGKTGVKALLFTLFILLIASQLAAEPRGLTTRELESDGIMTERLLPSPIVPIQPQQNGMPDINRDEWIAVDSLQIYTWLDAGKTIGVQYNFVNQSILTCTNMNPLTTSARQAIAKSPDWIKPPLTQVFYQLTAYDQDIWADVINSAVDPYVDEITFSIAHSSSQYLSSIYANPQMMLENAQQIYAADLHLNYVQIYNYGSSISGGDYYSTTAYLKRNAEGETIEVDVPRDIYYWYIVHPKITDEIPAYIDPGIVESNTTHANNIADPPVGQFWRTFLYNVQEGNYPVLSDTLMQCATLFNRDGTPGDALRAVQWWVNNTMSFTSNAERPHQPVRIYRKHFGRCGEYADYSAAAARAALIPCTSILSISTDHTWNEFWEDGWVQWEPVNGYINVPLVYENGWGKVFGSVFEIRSDGLFTSVTDRYSEGLASISIAVTDSLDRPVDGARVILAIYESGIRVDMVDFTDNQGMVTFPVGENRQYYMRLESPVGIYPSNPGTYAMIVDNSVNGQEYTFNVEIANALTVPNITQTAPPADPSQDWRFMISFAAPYQLITGVSTWDDIDIVGTVPKCYKKKDQAGSINLLMTDADNYMMYLVAQEANAFHVMQNVPYGNALFNIPADQHWYAFLDNGCHVANTQCVTAGVLYEHFGASNQDDMLYPAGLALLPASPNPFRTGIDIRFRLGKDSHAVVGIYNVKGQKVRVLADEPLKQGFNRLSWDGTDFNGRQAGTGVYYYKVSAEGRTLSGKLLLVK
jgi:hypothetical protein